MLAPRSVRRTRRAVPSCVTTALMPLHVTPDAERLAATRVRTLEWLLACMAVAVDLEAAWARKRLLARTANVAV